VLLAAWLAVPRVASAQAGLPYVAPADEVFDHTGEPAAKPAAVPTPPSKPETPVVPPPATVSRWGKPVEYFGDLWTRRRAALTAGQKAQAQALLDEMVEAKRSAGWPDHFAYGEALVREAMALHRDRAEDQALAVANAAVEMAPHRPSIHWAIAKVQFRASGHFWGALASLSRATTLWITEPGLRRVQLGSLWIAISLGLLVAAAAFTGAAAYRHARQFSHDIFHMLPKFATRLQAGLIAGALLVLPVAIRLGVTWVLLVWLILLAVYFDVHERIGAVLSLSVLAALPLLLPSLVHYLAYPGSRAQYVYQAARDMGATDAARALSARTDLGADDAYALGLRARWSGDLTNAAGYFKRALASGANDAELWTSMGNVFFWLGDPQKAIQSYDKAIAKNPDDFVAYFDKSRVHYSLAEHQKAGEAARHATAIDYSETEKLTELSKRAPAGYLADEPVPYRLLAPATEESVFEAGAADEIWHWFANETPRVFFAAYAILAAVVVVMAGWFRMLLFPAGFCSRCGRPSCQRCSPELPDTRDHCADCYHAFVAEDPVEPQIRIQKELEARRYQARDARVRQVMMFLLAGAGHLVRGAAWRGLGFVAAFSATLILLLAAAGILPDPVSDGFFWRPVASALLALVLACIYGAALWDAIREEQS